MIRHNFKDAKNYKEEQLLQIFLSVVTLSSNSSYTYTWVLCTTLIWDLKILSLEEDLYQRQYKQFIQHVFFYQGL